MRLGGVGQRQSVVDLLHWHQHVRGLIAESKPGLDAELLAHILLGSLHSDLVVHLIRRGETERLTTTLRGLVTTLLT